MANTEMIFGGFGGASSADKVSYDNNISGLESGNVQGAIDEVNSGLKSTKLIAKKTVEGPYSVTWTFVRQGNFVSFSCYSSGTSIPSAAAWTVKIIDAFPAGYKPASQAYYVGYATGQNKTIILSAQSTGCSINTFNSASTYIICSGSYITNDEFPIEDALA